MLIDPKIIRVLGRPRVALQRRPRQGIKTPTFWAFLARLGPRTIERAFASAAIEAADMAAVERHPHDAIAIHIHAANAIARQWHSVDLGQRRVGRIRSGIDAQDIARMRQARAPDRAVRRAHGDAVKSKWNAGILARIKRLAGLVIALVAPAVAVGIDHERAPALRRRSIAS